ncbi:MAG: hypothetical protein NT155_04235 [Candidatus Staskawiczbacteria bacterium]|nr:hypothetical protein [Candidatus Staskawiczbacteria bacterium]
MSKETENFSSADEPKDNVIEVDFLGKKGDGGKSENFSLEEWIQAHEKASGEMSKFLKSLKGSASERAFHEAFATIQGFSNVELAKAVLNSNEKDWTSKPGYYRALVEEMRLRLADQLGKK